MPTNSISALRGITVAALEEELLQLYKECPSFEEVGFSAFNEEDFEASLDGNTSFPAVATMFSGMLSQEALANEVTAASNKDHSAKLVQLQFVVLVACRYMYGSQADRKARLQMIALLDEARTKVLGYQNVNARPWRFYGERPELDASGNGYIIYSQIWRTGVMVVGSFNS